MSKMRVFLVHPSASPHIPGGVDALETITIAADGDDAKKAGKVALADMGYAVRSMNWSPNAQGGLDLLAYVTKGA